MAIFQFDFCMFTRLGKNMGHFMGPIGYPWFFSQRLSFICFSRMCISRGVSEADLKINLPLPWWFHVDGIFNSI